MKRPFVTFLVLVVLPSAVTMVATDRAATHAWSALRDTSSVRVGRMALEALAQELGAAVSELVTAAEPVTNPDTTSPSIRRALEGDTVTGLDPSGDGASVVVVAPDTTAGSVRFATRRLDPEAAAVVSRVTGFHVGLYLSGRPWVLSDPESLPASLGGRATDAASRSSEGVVERGLALVSLGGTPGVSAAVVAAARPARAAPSALPTEVRLVMALLLLFAVLTAWIQLARPADDVRRQPAGVLSVFLLATIPTLSAVVLMVHAGRLFDEEAPLSTSSDLNRGLSVAGALGYVRSPTGFRALTGFHMARVSGGVVDSSTLPGDHASIAALPAPPPSFSSAGSVETELGRTLYVARRFRGQGTVYALAPEPTDQRSALQGRLLLIGGALLGWFALAGLWQLAGRGGE